MQLMSLKCTLKIGKNGKLFSYIHYHNNNFKSQSSQALKKTPIFLVLIQLHPCSHIHPYSLTSESHHFFEPSSFSSPPLSCIHFVLHSACILYSITLITLFLISSFPFPPFPFFQLFWQNPNHESVQLLTFSVHMPELFSAAGQHHTSFYTDLKSLLDIPSSLALCFHVENEILKFLFLQTKTNFSLAVATSNCQTKFPFYLIGQC